MGKKKGNKDEANGDELVEENSTPASKDAGKKSKRSKKNLEPDWEDDVARELEEMTLEEAGMRQEKEPEHDPVPEKKKEKKPKKTKVEVCESEEEEVVVKSKKGGGFAALMDEGDDDDGADNDDMIVPIVDEKKDKKKNKKEDKPKAVVEDKNDKKKGKKGKKKKNDEEDLDQILAELELEYKEEKPKEATKKEEETTEETSQLTEDSGKKKKKKKKDAVESEKIEAPSETNDSVLENNDTHPEENDTVTKEGGYSAVKAQKDASSENIVKVGEPNEKKEDEALEEPSKSKKKKKKAKDAAAVQAEGSKEGTPAPEDQGEEGEGDGDEGAGKKKKKKKKDKEVVVEEEDKSRKGKPSKKALAAMREILAKQKEEEERLRKEEEERIRQEEEALRQLEEEKRIEQEKKERKKQREKERKERLKAEGKLLTPKQKAEQRRAQEMLEHLKAQGVVLPGTGEKRPRPGTKIKPKKKKDEKTEGVSQEEPEGVTQEEPGNVPEDKPVELEEGAVTPIEEVKEEEEEVKDAWDETSDEDEEMEEDTSETTKTSQDTDSKKMVNNKRIAGDEDMNEDDSDDDVESESEESIDEQLNEAEKRKQRAVARMAKRKEENLKKLDPDNLRAPVVCVLGHVDHGKTKILDKLRRTNVQEGEVGGITQQIGATNVPAEAIKRQTHMVKDFDMGTLKFPGLLIIDTPGHESFRNLRSRGSSLCDIAILVVDITQGLEPQTCESVNLLRSRATPFIVALNKVDRVYEWDSHPSKDIREIINLQAEPSRNDFDRRTAQVIQGLREEKLNSALFWENPNPKEYISLVPTSAISGDGMGNLISLICNLCQHRLKKNLMFSEELQCTVLEVKTIQGHGTTIDVILVNGRLREGDTIVLAGTEGPIVTQIRSLLLPKPLKEIRVKGQYDEFKEISAAQGVKIAARDLEKAIAGLSLKVAYHEDELEVIKEVIDKEFKAAMRSIKVKDRGVYVQASTLGALEALLEFFKTNEVPYSGIRVGPVVKRDVMKAAAMLEHDPMYAVILAFDVKVEKDAQELADKEGVKIFSEETIYHLGDRYVEYIKDYKKKKQDEFRNVAVFPSKLKIIPTAIFNKRDPIVLGVTVDAGVLRTGTPLCVPSKEFVEIGIVTSMEFDHKNVDLAKKGVDVCIKIEPVPGHTPKLVGRHFEAEDILVSKISRESINACKDHFREDLSKTDWKLMAELKKQFQIL